MKNDHATKSVSIVIPVYHGEQTLSELTSRIAAVLQPLEYKFEIILVNDGSKDHSWETICKLASEHSWIRGFDLMQNYGQHNALLIGVRAALYENVVTMDDDLQHPPEEIPALLNVLSETCFIAYGMPRELRHSLLRNLSARGTKFLLHRFMGMKSMTDTSPFRAFHTELRDAFSVYNGPYVDIDALLIWATDRRCAIQLNFDRRHSGASSYTLKKLIEHTLNMVVDFSVIPLRLADYIGFALTLFGVFILGKVLVGYFFLGGSIPGFPFLASIISIFSGAQLFSLGIIGEYVIRIHFRIMGKPTAVIRRQAGTHGSDVSRTVELSKTL